MDAQVQKSTTKLVTSLEDIIGLYRQLLEVVRKERELLVAADRQGLEDNNMLKEQLLLKLKLADASRLRSATDLARLIGADAEAPRLQELSQKLGSPAGDKLRTQHSTLEVMIGRIVSLNKENEEYAQAALKNLNGAMGEIKETISGKSTYEKKGQVRMGPQVSGNFVRKEA